jgi:hypothetical protein
MPKLPSNPRFIPILLCGVALVGCEGTSDPELNVLDPTLDQAANAQSENPFLGSWKLTSVVVGDVDHPLPGPPHWFTVTFLSDGTMWSSVYGDVNHEVCEAPDTSCGWGGTYTYTRTTYTTDEPDHPNPEERGEDTGMYAFCGNELIRMDSGGDDPAVRAVFERARRDCYARDCA